MKCRPRTKLSRAIVLQNKPNLTLILNPPHLTPPPHWDDWWTYNTAVFFYRLMVFVKVTGYLSLIGSICLNSLCAAVVAHWRLLVRETFHVRFPFLKPTRLNKNWQNSWSGIGLSKRRMSDYYLRFSTSDTYIAFARAVCGQTATKTVKSMDKRNLNHKRHL